MTGAAKTGSGHSKHELLLETLDKRLVISARRFREKVERPLGQLKLVSGLGQNLSQHVPAFFVNGKSLVGGTSKRGSHQILPHHRRIDIAQCAIGKNKARHEGFPLFQAR